MNRKAQRVAGRVLGSYVDQAQRLVAEKVRPPAGYHYLCCRGCQLEGLRHLAVSQAHITTSVFQDSHRVPRQRSSGDRNLLLGISKRGDRYLRTRFPKEEKIWPNWFQVDAYVELARERGTIQR